MVFHHRNPMSSLEAVSSSELAHLRIQHEDIAHATNNFAEEYLLKRGGKADAYKGLLLRPEVPIHVVIWKYSITSLTFEFYEVIKRMSRNIESFVGFCDEKDEWMIVMEHVVDRILHKDPSDPTLKSSQRLNICFDAALALNKIHDAIRSFKILLDTEDSDVYSFGVILLEVLNGRKATIKDVNQYIEHYEEGKQLDDIIHPNMRQMHTESLSVFSETAYNCLKKQPDQQSPYIFEQIVKRLKEAFDIQWKHENHAQLKGFDYLKIELKRIVSATDNFSITHSITSNMYERMYKAELGKFDRISGQTKKKVIIKRIFSYDKLSKDFFEEIEMLNNCKHPNLLSFLGFCDEDSQMILVFECAFKETLNGYLRSRRERTNFTWEKRICICLDIARGLKYLRNEKHKPSMILSASVFLDEEWTAIIADFKLSEFNSCQTHVMDDIYFLGVTLFEILTGRLAYDPLYTAENVNGFATMARRHFNDETLKNIADSRIMQETEFMSYTLKGPNKDSFNTFSKIAYQCLAESPNERPTLEDIILSLNEALQFQEQSIERSLRIPLEDILLATKSFNCSIKSGGYGDVYKAELKLRSKDEGSKTSHTVAIKRIVRKEDGGKAGFYAEIDVLGKCNHQNVVSLLGFCSEKNELILVYEYASYGSLDSYLSSTFNFNWPQRLKICIEIAHGLQYLHTTFERKENIIHRDIKSANILLGENLEVKIADFGLSKVGNLWDRSMYTINIAGTNFYWDPEYARTGRLKKASDIYSFGVVLFEIFSGKLASDKKWEDINGLAPIARRHFKKGTIKEILDPEIMNEAHELSSTLKVGPDPESLIAFTNIAYRCLAKTQAARPAIEEVVKELMKALEFQKATLKISLEDITLGVEIFSDANCIIEGGGGGHGKLYRGEIKYNKGHKNVVVKRFIKLGQERAFLKEFEALSKYKQQNIIGLVGYCKEKEEKIIVYEDASNGCLSTCLDNSSLSWSTRLKICIDIANGLKFLHEGYAGQDIAIHRDIKSSNILLTGDWKAKICGFEFALIHPRNKEIQYDIGDVVVSACYCDPLYQETKIFTKESDIYSLGVILFEILCGRLACPEDDKDQSMPLNVLVEIHSKEKQLEEVESHSKEKLLEEIVFEGIKKHMVQKSFDTFRTIAFKCLSKKREERPTATDVVIQLQKALAFQEAYKTHKAILDRTYKEILDEFSSSPERKNDIYYILSKGILLEDDKLLIEQTVREDDEDYHSDSMILPTTVGKYSLQGKRRHIYTTPFEKERRHVHATPFEKERRHMQPITPNTELVASISSTLTWIQNSILERNDALLSHATNKISE